MTTMREVDSYLEHFGVKGQQWGVRNVRRSTPAEKRAKAVGHLSNAELKAHVDRMNLERNYAQLTAPKVTLGHEIALNTLKQHGGYMAALALKKAAPVLKKGAEVVVGLIAVKVLSPLVESLMAA